jgi:hypothetical protein
MSVSAGSTTSICETCWATKGVAPPVATTSAAPSNSAATRRDQRVHHGSGPEDRARVHGSTRGPADGRDRPATGRREPGRRINEGADRRRYPGGDRPAEKAPVGAHGVHLRCGTHVHHDGVRPAGDVPRRERVCEAVGADLGRIVGCHAKSKFR